jgi:hypothetical protein
VAVIAELTRDVLTIGASIGALGLTIILWFVFKRW